MTKFFSEDAEKVNCEMHQLNSAMKYGFGMLGNTRSTITVYEDGLWIRLGKSKWKSVSDIVTPSGAFP